MTERPWEFQSQQRASIQHGLPSLTTMEAGFAAVSAIRALQRGTVNVRSLQEYHE
ncbi:MAG: hypothetical protein V3T83_05865 [Acidobacteriota bacterium]